MTTMLGTDLDCATQKLCVSDEKQDSHPKLTAKSPPESHPLIWDTFDKWISHIRRMDLSFAGVLFLYNSTLQLVRLT